LREPWTAIEKMTDRAATRRSAQACTQKTL
jgi:hypothetical protein